MSVTIKGQALNIVIYKYLLEAGLPHTAFALFAEASLVHKINLYEPYLRPGHLVSLLERGLTLEHIERHLVGTESFTECREPTDLVRPHVCKVVGKVNNRGDQRDRAAIQEIRRSASKYKGELARLATENEQLG